MNYQYHNSIIGVGTVFLLSLTVLLRVPLFANIGIFVLALGAVVILFATILDINAMSDKKPDILERNRGLKMAPIDTARIHRIVLVISTLMVAARGRFFFMLAALMAFSLITGSVWANEVRKLQEVSNDHG